jgi:hypothetical protein
MILGQDILRLLTVKAIRNGRTWVGDRVFDSPALPADIKIETDREPFIAVYTDDADLTLEGGSFHNPDSQVYLLIECAVANVVTVPPKPPDSNAQTPPGLEQTIRLSQTDEALELSIGCMAQQAIQALMDDKNPWAELWRTFAPRRYRVETRRGGPGQQAAQSAVRFASRVMRMQVEVLADPVYGEGIPNGFWKDFFAMAEADPDYGRPDPETKVSIADLLRSHFETTPGIPSWKVEQRRGTYTRQGVASLGIVPPIFAQEEEEEAQNAE